MESLQTMERTEILIDGASALLAQEQDIDALLEQFLAAAAGPPAFVEFVVVGNRRVRVLVTPRTRIVITTASVQYDPRDTGDLDQPWGGLYDLDHASL